MVLKNWNEKIAIELAQSENIKLTQDHWDVIYLLRDFYKNYNSTPAIRILIKLMREKYGPDKGNSLHLHKLFSKPAIQGCKIAGLPKPTRCT